MQTQEPIRIDLLDNISKQTTSTTFKRNFKAGLIWAFIGYFFFAINLLSMKSINNMFPEGNPLAFMMYRSISIYAISHYFLLRDGLPVSKALTLKLKWTFMLRVTLNFIGFYTLVLLLNYFRVVTVSLITSTHPIFVNLFSYFILNSKLHARYIVGFSVCFIGTYLLVSKDGNGQTDSKYSNKLVGCLLGLAHVSVIGYMLVINKILLNNNINSFLICAWVGITNALCGLLGVILTVNYVNFFDFSFAFWSLLNGVIFYCGFISLNFSFQNVSPNSTTAISYTTTVYTAIIGLLFYGEHLYWTDLLGFVSILGYNIYHVMVPIKG